MGLLTAFNYVFTADTKQLDKGVDDAEKKTSNLTKGMGELQKSGDMLASSFRGVIAGAVGSVASVFALGAIVGAAKEAAEYALELDNVSYALRVNAGELSAWQAANQSAGGTVDGMNQSVGALRKGLDEFRKTGGGPLADTLHGIGIHMRNAAGKIKEPLELLPQLADKFAKLSAIKKNDLAEKLGIGDGTIRLLSRGRDAVEEMVKKQKELGTVTEKDIEVSRAYKNQQEDTGRVWKRLAMDAGQFVLPALTWMLRKFEDIGMWMRSNKELIYGVLIGIGAVVAAFVIPPLITAAAATWAFLAPWLLIGAAIAAVIAIIALAAEDILIFLDGGDSLLGKAIEKWPQLGLAIQGVGQSLKLLWEIAKAVFGLLVDLLTGNVSGAFDAFRAKLGKAFDDFLNKLPGLKQALSEVMAWFQKVGDTIKAVWDKVGGFFGKSSVTMEAAKGGLAATNVPLASTSSQAIANSNSQSSKSVRTEVGKVEIHTQATDADGIAGAVAQSLHSQIQQTNDQFDDGVIA